MSIGISLDFVPLDSILLFPPDVWHIRCMHARPHRRKDQLPLQLLLDLCSRQVSAPVRPRLAR